MATVFVNIFYLTDVILKFIVWVVLTFKLKLGYARQTNCSRCI